MSREGVMDGLRVRSKRTLSASALPAGQGAPPTQQWLSHNVGPLHYIAQDPKMPWGVVSQETSEQGQ